MSYENVLFGKECREKLIEGVNLCVDAVETTYGPHGRNSLIMTPSGVQITKDGFHTAMAVNDPDTYVMMGVKLVQDTCKKTAKDAGDGPQPLWAKILTPYGWKKMEDIKVGDEICGTNQTIQKVIGVFPKGKKKLYKVKFSSGKEVECCEDHLWSCYKVTSTNPKLKTIPLKEIISNGFCKKEKDGSTAHLFYVPKTITEFYSDKSKMTLDPFLIGLLLSDGSLSGTGSIELSLALDQDYLLDQIKLPEGLYLHYQKNEKKHYLRVKIEGVTPDGKCPKDFISELGLFGTKSDTKFVPDCYLYASYQDRLELLRGLTETDGHINSRGLLEYSTISSRLKDNILELLHSLGKSTHCWLNPRKTKSKGSYNSRPIYKISELVGYKYGEKIIDIIDTGEYADMQCIKVSNPDQLYITDSYVVTHNTSTSSLLIKELVNAYSNVENPIKFCRKLSQQAQDILSEIAEHKWDVQTEEDLFNVASVSANNDPIIGKLIAEAFSKVGKDGVVTFEESDGVQDRVEYTEGFRIDSGYSSPYFINTPKGNCELENVRVYISDTKMDEVKKVIALADQAVKDKKSLLLIAPEFDSEILVFLSSNLELLKSCTVLSPNRRNYRQIMLEDMQILLGETSECKKVIITKNNTTFVGCENNKSEIDERVKSIRDRLTEEDTLPEFDLEFHRKRLANFTSGIATIFVGGYSPVEMKERYDRIEDSVCATQAALKMGIVPGGGKAFDYVKNPEVKELVNLIAHATQSKLQTEDKTPEDMINAGVIEPFLVTKTVLENAVATAALILTANVAILNMNEFMN